MAKSTTLLQLRTDARLYADQRPGGASDSFITDAEANRLINLAIGEFYDRIVKQRGSSYFVNEYTRSTISDDIGASTTVSRYALPSDFYQLLSLTLEWGTQDHEIIGEIPSMGDRSWEYNLGAWGRGVMKGYRIRSGTSLEIIPKATSAVTMRMQYIPVYTTLAADGDTFDGINGWERVIALRVANEMREIESNPSPGLREMYQAELDRVDNMMLDRSVESTPQVLDVSPERTRFPWPGYLGRASSS